MNKNARQSEELIVQFVSERRNALLDMVKETAKVAPADWDTIHTVMAELLGNVLMGYTRALMLTTKEVSRLEAGLEPNKDLGEELLKENVESVVLSTILMAHMEVLKDVGCRMNDAHLHLDRVRRAADKEVSIAAVEIFTRSRGGDR
jgi:hypothetical protein